VLGLWLWAGVSVALLAASWALEVVYHRRAIALALALVAIISLAYAIYGMVAYCEAPPGSACL
jgi:hypothetical protein